MTSPRLDRLIGLTLVLVTGCVIAREWGAADWVNIPCYLLLVVAIAALFVEVRPGRKAFVFVALGLTAALAWRVEDWTSVVMDGLYSASFIAAFFTALATLRSAAEPSEDIRASGRFLAEQPPGRRYLALTLGASAFALLLNYGAIALLGSLATAAAQDEPDAEIRMHRRRRISQRWHVESSIDQCRTGQHDHQQGQCGELFDRLFLAAGQRQRAQH